MTAEDLRELFTLNADTWSDTYDYMCGGPGSAAEVPPPPPPAATGSYSPIDLAAVEEDDDRAPKGTGGRPSRGATSGTQAGCGATENGRLAPIHKRQVERDGSGILNTSAHCAGTLSNRARPMTQRRYDPWVCVQQRVRTFLLPRKYIFHSCYHPSSYLSVSLSLLLILLLSLWFAHDGVGASILSFPMPNNALKCRAWGCAHCAVRGAGGRGPRELGPPPQPRNRSRCGNASRRGT